MGCSEWARCWLFIESVHGIGAPRWIGLSKTMGVSEIAEMIRSEEGRERLTRMLGRPVSAVDERLVDDQLALLEKGGYDLVSISDEHYPPLLRQIAVPPPLLYFKGSLDALSKPCVCVVGSRRASRRGLITAGGLARDLSACGVHVVSGLARGIDSAAHEGALEGKGGTSAVLGCGLDAVYPRENAALAGRIAESGSVLSEFPLGSLPLRQNFPRRNRILSGLSCGVVVVEAGPSSGAMGTAMWAVEQGRDVFAVPGPIDYPGSRGPHRLIRDGARLVEGVEDILAELPSHATVGCWIDRGAAHDPQRFTERERAIVAALDLNPKHIDELVQFCDISPTAILPVLLDLEMRGVIASCGGGAYALAAPRRKG